MKFELGNFGNIWKFWGIFGIFGNFQNTSKIIKGTSRSEGVLFYLQCYEHDFIIRD